MPTLLKKVRDDLKKFGRESKDYPLLQVTNLETRPSVGIKSITYKSVVIGQDTKNYLAFAQFFKVPFQKEIDQKFTNPVNIRGRGVMYHPSPSVKENPVSLKCSCFTGDTLIPLADGYSVPIKDLVG